MPTSFSVLGARYQRTEQKRNKRVSEIPLGVARLDNPQDKASTKHVGVTANTMEPQDDVHSTPTLRVALTQTPGPPPKDQRDVAGRMASGPLKKHKNGSSSTSSCCIPHLLSSASPGIHKHRIVPHGNAIQRFSTSAPCLTRKAPQTYHHSSRWV